MLSKLAFFTFLLSLAFWYLTSSGKIEVIAGPDYSLCSAMAGMMIETTASSHATVYQLDEEQTKELKTLFKKEFCLCAQPLTENKIQTFKNRQKTKTVIQNCSTRALKLSLEKVLILFD